jgi:hypothetical protein
MTRACLVSDPAFGLDDVAGRLCEAALAAFRGMDLAAVFRRDLGLVIRTFEVCATLSAAPPQPCLGKHPAGPATEAGFWRPQVTHSNAPIMPEIQSIPSKIVAQWMVKIADFYFIIKGFEYSHPSQSVRRSAGLPKICAIGPEIPAFRVFDFVSGLRILQSWGANCRKSPVTSANIPVLRRLSAETGFDHDCRPTIP